jgi:hypothetical protein
MKKSIFLLLLVIISSLVGAQTIDKICLPLINQKSTNIISYLDSSNVVRNFYIGKDNKKKTGANAIIGLRDGNNISYVIKLYGTNVEAGRVGTYDDYIIIKSIIINFPHSSSEHINSLKQIDGYKRHVGVYSTDLTIK